MNPLGRFSLEKVPASVPALTMAYEPFA